MHNNGRRARQHAYPTRLRSADPRVIDKTNYILSRVPNQFIKRIFTPIFDKTHPTVGSEPRIMCAARSWLVIAARVHLGAVLPVS